MTGWEKGIVDLFLARYPGSAAAGLGGDPPDPAAGPSPGKVLRIGLDRLFPGFETAPPDARESFLEAAESLEKRGLVFIRWIRRRKGEALSALVCPDPEALFVFAGKPSPAAVAEAAREAARGIARTAPNQGIESLFAFLAESISAEDALRGINAVAVGDLYSLIRSLPDAPGPPRGITPRALSVSLYGDSKRLEEILRLFGRILSRAERRGIGRPDFSALERSFPDTLIAGKINIRFESRPPLVNAGGYILGLPLTTVLKIRGITPFQHDTSRPDPGTGEKPRVLTIENKETFYALAEDPQTLPGFTCFLYTAGHPNGAVRALVSILAASGFSFFHAGDPDPEGILILQELAEIAGKPVIPIRMDGPAFDRYAHCGRKLEPTMLSRISLINEATLRLPGIKELIKKIQETGLGIEQEIIDYRFSTPDL